VALHDGQELDDDFRAGPDQDLALARLLGVVDGIERIVEDGGLDHFDGYARFSVASCDGGICSLSVSPQKPEQKECPQMQLEGSSALVAEGKRIMFIQMDGMIASPGSLKGTRNVKRTYLVGSVVGRGRSLSEES
jgi:hypothetical protein